MARLGTVPYLTRQIDLRNTKIQKYREVAEEVLSRADIYTADKLIELAEEAIKFDDKFNGKSG